MENILNNITQIIILNGAVMMIPGVNFLLVARQSIINGIHAGLFCTCGITIAVVSHALLAALSVSVLITKYPFLFTFIRYTGAAYLVYLGTSFLRKALQNHSNEQNEVLAGISKNLKGESFRSGFLVDLFNPFISIFYFTLFSSMTLSDNKVFELSCYLSVIFALSIIWFSLVAVFFNHPIIRDNLQSKSRYIQALSGLAMYYFSAKVVFEF